MTVRGVAAPGAAVIAYGICGYRPSDGALRTSATIPLRPNAPTALKVDPAFHGGRVFGATVLGTGVPRRAPARALMRTYNARGIFHNAADSPDALQTELAARFRSYDLTVRGCIALFEATV